MKKLFEEMQKLVLKIEEDVKIGKRIFNEKKSIRVSDFYFYYKKEITEIKDCDFFTIRGFYFFIKETFEIEKDQYQMFIKYFKKEITDNLDEKNEKKQLKKEKNKKKKESEFSQNEIVKTNVENNSHDATKKEIKQEPFEMLSEDEKRNVPYAAKKCFNRGLIGINEIHKILIERPNDIQFFLGLLEEHEKNI